MGILPRITPVSRPAQCARRLALRRYTSASHLTWRHTYLYTVFLCVRWNFLSSAISPQWMGEYMTASAIRWTATFAKIMSLLLWHAIRHPHTPSMVDFEAGTVRLVGG